MANTTNTKVATKANTTKAATKEVKKVTDNKKVTPKVTEKKKVNRERKTMTMAEISEIMKSANLHVYNETAKGNYRIIGSKSGSSLNVQTQKYILFSTDTDFDMVSAVKDKYADLVLEKGANSQDKCRKNAIKFTEKTTLEAIIKLMAKAYPVAVK